MKVFVEGESIGSVELEFFEKELARKVLEVLPMEVVPNFWGDEIYFEIPIGEVKASSPTKVVEEGDVAVWIENPSLCIFFGKTPISTGDEILAYSEVEVIGRVKGDPKVFKKLRKGERIKVFSSQD